MITSDSGKGLQKAWRSLGLVSASAKHNQAEYTPTACINKKDLGFEAKDTVLRCKRAKESRTSITMVAADQRCQALANTVKKWLRRTNKLGQKCSASNRDHIDALAAFSINAEPGIEAVVEAVVAYREWLEDRVSPAMSFQESSWLGLLDKD